MSQQTALAVADEERADDDTPKGWSLVWWKRPVTAAVAAIRRRPHRRGASLVGDVTEDRVDAADDATESTETQAGPEEVDHHAPWLRSLLIAGVIICLALGGLVGWLAVRAHQSQADQHRRELFLAVGRQGAVNLTSIDYTHVEVDIQRVLDCATGSFYEDFRQRSPAFADVVTRAKSKTVGTVTAAGLESVTAGSAQVLVTVSVSTSNAASADQPPRHWRMRIDVQETGDSAKVSKVVFVP
jgi:Mce-associated membrane protein